jgi:hypothetical protein
MIAQHNRKQIILTAVCLLVALFGFTAAFYFFDFAFRFAADAFGWRAAVRYSRAFASAVLVIIGVGGFLRWKNGEGFYGYADSSFFTNFEPLSGGAIAVDRGLHRVTGPAYILSQIFLLGPLQLLSAYGHFRSMIPQDQALERGLEDLLVEIRSKKKWEEIVNYPGREKEVALLIRIGKLDFSRTKMRFCAKDDTAAQRALESRK